MLVYFVCSFSAYLTVKDAESGVKSITASIYDKTLKVTVWSDTRPPVTLQPADSRRKRVSVIVLSLLNISFVAHGRFLTRMQSIP